MPFTQTALDEIELILDGALKYGGAEHARKVRTRFQRLFDHIDRGVGLGSARPDIGLGDEIRFVSTTPYPFLIVVDRRLRLVLRVIHARRDYRDMVIDDYFPV
ncbi:type II toxin-antitoxin system RelE/ParE family toxin [Lichenibacterium dinghuense]|uniref:type II toxin-antitoxin system RelE/ParE family toxin n=1 Tax=Lichenibacterium dinghuense TaxID=2895977 RepID=UPI001F41C741|nr:type II toxin-antitoxin system RelE/ParE family toxin [Lichenibacterium sp. 6Y81]